MNMIIKEQKKLNENNLFLYKYKTTPLNPNNESSPSNLVAPISGNIIFSITCSLLFKIS